MAEYVRRRTAAGSSFASRMGRVTKRRVPSLALLALTTIHHRGRSGIEVSEQQLSSLTIDLTSLQRIGHQLHPSIARCESDGERRVAHAKARMPSILDVARRPTKTKDQEVSKAPFRARQIVGRVQRAEDIITGDLLVELCNEASEAFFSDRCVDLSLFHEADASILAPRGGWSLESQNRRQRSLTPVSPTKVIQQRSLWFVSNVTPFQSNRHQLNPSVARCGSDRE